jgi:hypothetical protein
MMKIHHLVCIMALIAIPGARATGGSLSPGIGAADGAEAAAIRAGHASADPHQGATEAPDKPDTKTGSGAAGK